MCRKYRKVKNTKILDLFYKTLVISFISSKCGGKRKRIFNQEESIEISKVLGLIKNILLLSKYGRKKTQTLTLELKKKKIHESRNYFLEEIKYN